MATAGEAVRRSGATDFPALVRKIDGLAPDAERAFVHLYGRSAHSFWLDSSAGGERGRFSFVGDATGPRAAVVTYDVRSGLVRVERRGRVEVRRESIFDFLSAAIGQVRAAPAELPFDFDCGFAGFLGYESKADCGSGATHRAATPDAAFVFADRLIAFDHEEGCAYLLSLPHRAADEWIEATSRRLRALPPLPEPAPQGRVELRLRRSAERYLEDIAACKRHLRAGHSYEICLTDQLVGEAECDSLALYRCLRRVNPAPFSAYLRFGELAVASSSPERFLSIDRDGGVEARPIKGTSRRGEDAIEDARLARALRTDPKSRAENVTIVDLMRNDLGRVCEVGSVEAAETMRLETYETVHQLVSSVRGRLAGGFDAVDCVRACFPPGSMTGAPKLRTMEIVDELEGAARGVYSGAIGYFGLGGAADLSVAIRTIVLDGRSLSIGAGGAIVVDSDPTAELEEMLIKASAPAAALASPDGASVCRNGRTVSPVNFS